MPLRALWRKGGTKMQKINKVKEVQILSVEYIDSNKTALPLVYSLKYNNGGGRAEA